MSSGARRLATRAGWGVGDQILSSATNFALGVLVARSTDAIGLGEWSLVFWTYLLLLNLARSTGAQPLIVLASAATTEDWRQAVRAVTGLGAVIGIVAALVIAPIGLLLGGAGESAVVLAIGLPILLVQDAYRYGLVAAGRARAAFASDLGWAAVMGAEIAIVAISGLTLSVPAIVAIWIVGALGGALVGAGAARLAPSLGASGDWLRENRALATGFAVGSMVDTLAQTAIQFALAFVAGLATVGAIRAALLLLSPILVTYQGLLLVAAPEARRLLSGQPARLPRYLATFGLALGAVAVIGGAAALLLPPEVGRHVVGETRDAAAAVLPLIVIATAVRVAGGGASAGLVALGAAKAIARVSIWTSALMIMFVIGGAVVGGAVGAAAGFAAGYLVTSLATWRAFIGAYSQHDPRPGHGEVVAPTIDA